MASGKTAMTDTVNELRTKYGLHCATNPKGLTHPKKDASAEERDAYEQALYLYKIEVREASRALRRKFFAGVKTLTRAEQRESDAEGRAKQLAGATARRAAVSLVAEKAAEVLAEELTTP